MSVSCVIKSLKRAFKAYYSHRFRAAPPYTHNLSLLAEKNGFYSELTEEQKNFLDFLEPLNIEARYPTQKQKLLALLNSKKCDEIIQQTEKELIWVMKKL